MSEAKRQMAMVREFRDSGKSQRVWCAENGIKRGTMRYWLERTEILSLGTEIKFAELVPVNELAQAGDAEWR